MNSKKLSHIFSVIIIVLLIGISIVLIINNEDNSNKEVKDYEEFIFLTNDENNVVKEVKNGYEITLNNYYALELNDYITDNKYRNITINGFKLDNIESTLYIENIARNADCIEDKKYPKITLSDIVIEELENEACYLVVVGEIFIIENKYLGIIYYLNENMENRLVIYNNEGIPLYTRDITDFNLEKFVFIDYEEDDLNYYLNEYKLVKKNGKIEDILIKNGTEQFCDRMNEIGVCEE